MDKYFRLTVSKGTKIYNKDGVTVLDGVPENAMELLEAGADYIRLNKESSELLKDWDKERLEKVLELRKKQGIDEDVDILETVIKSKSKPESKQKIEK